jgi:hypothetical protein
MRASSRSRPRSTGALAGADTASLLALDDRGWALVLGSAHPLVHLATSSGGVFARVVSHAGTDEALEAVLARAPVGGWQSIGEVEVREAVRVFDAATFGGAIGEGNSLALALSPGVHQVGYRTWRPDAGTELRLVRLHRA